MDYHQKSTETITALLPTIRNLPDLAQQKAIIAAYPFGKHNPEAWRIYFTTVNKLRGGRMGGV